MLCGVIAVIKVLSARTADDTTPEGGNYNQGGGNQVVTYAPVGRDVIGGDKTVKHVERDFVDGDKYVFNIQPRAEPSTPPDQKGKTFLSKLPTATPDFLGRDKELGELDDVWEDSHKRIMMLSAWGGVGKSALVGHWLEKMPTGRLSRGEARIRLEFLQSGPSEDRQVGADQFIAHALDWFGDPTQPRAHPGTGAFVWPVS